MEKLSLWKKVQRGIILFVLISIIIFLFLALAINFPRFIKTIIENPKSSFAYIMTLLVFFIPLVFFILATANFIRRKSNRLILKLIFILIIFFTILIGTCFLFFIPSKVIDGSVANGKYKEGQIVLSERFSYFFRKPRIGDVVIFKNVRTIRVGQIDDVKEEDAMRVYFVKHDSGDESRLTKDRIMSRVYWGLPFKEEKLPENQNEELQEETKKEEIVKEIGKEKIPEDEMGKIIKNIGEEFKKSYKDSDIFYRLNSYLWWISPDGLNIINDNSLGIELNLSCEVNKSPLKEALALVIPKIDEIFKNEGYLLNEINSSSSIEDEEFVDYVRAYEKGEIKCALVGEPDCGRSLSEEEYKYESCFKELDLNCQKPKEVTESTYSHQTIAVKCTDNYEKNFQNQAPFLRDLGLKDVIISVAKEKDDFIYLKAHYRRTGYYIIAKKENDKWKEIFSGQDQPNCDLVEKYEIPKEIYGECYSAPIP